MPFDRADETDLLTALYAGVHETPLWESFLHRLRRLSRADHVSIIFARTGESVHDGLQWCAGPDLRSEARKLADFVSADPVSHRAMRPGRVYALEELIDPSNARHERFRKDYLSRIGAGFSRTMRVAEANGDGNTWVSLVRANDDFGAADSARLAALAPHVAIATKTLAIIERERLEAKIAQNVLDRAGIAWTGRDAHGMALASLHVRLEGERGGMRVTKSDLSCSAVHIGDTNLLSVRSPAFGKSVVAAPVFVTISRLARPLTDEHATLFAEFHDLSLNEARLALLLAQDHSIVEAAAALGLTPETARNYSKRVYSRTRTRGLAELVRMVLTSVAILA